MAAQTNIIPLENVDPALVEELLDRAFEPTRRTRTSYLVREGMEWLPALSFAALGRGDQLVGTIQCWPVALTDAASRAHPIIMVGPVAVLPEHQGKGYGKAMMLASLGALNPKAPLPQMMIGDPEYYGRFFGFTNAYTGGWSLPGPFDQRRLLARADDPTILPQTGMLGPWRK